MCIKKINELGIELESVRERRARTRTMQERVLTISLVEYTNSGRKVVFSTT